MSSSKSSQHCGCFLKDDGVAKDLAFVAFARKTLESLGLPWLDLDAVPGSKVPTEMPIDLSATPLRSTFHRRFRCARISWPAVSANRNNSRGRNSAVDPISECG